MIPEWFKPVLRRLRVLLFRARHRRIVQRSGLFDAEWYLQHNPGLRKDRSAQRDALGHFLRHGRYALFNPGPGFDCRWYLERYPDVATSLLNPLVHYMAIGKREGRLPLPNRAIAYDHHLWRGLEQIMLPRLERLAQAAEATNPVEQEFARWSLARWYAWKGEWNRADALLVCADGPDDLSSLCGRHGPELLKFQAELEVGRLRDAEERLQRWARLFPNWPDRFLARANWIACQRGPARDEERLDTVNQIFRSQGLGQITHRDTGGFQIDALEAAPGSTKFPGGHKNEDLVSVIVPAHNCEATLATAVKSLLAQTWRPLELLLVDDASEDGTRLVMDSLADFASRVDGVEILLLDHPTNQGAYAARNTALAHAAGRWITVHDSDDWSHPEKIQRQVEAVVVSNRVRASVSHWVRATPAMVFERWQLDTLDAGWTCRNISSLLFEREVFDRLGFWDDVRVGADSEYYERILKVFGDSSVAEVLPGVPLAFGRVSEGSLTQTGETHLVTQFSGVRKDYIDYSRRWHQSTSGSDALYLPAKADPRPFPAPPALCRVKRAARQNSPLDTIQCSGYFDPVWYLSAYRELQERIVDPLEFHAEQGFARGYDPGPDFSTSGYALISAGTCPAGEDSLLHFLRNGQAAGLEPLPVLVGFPDEFPDRPWVCLCDEPESARLPHAERTLLDLMAALQRLRWNTLALLPNAIHPSYVERVRKRAQAVGVVPYAEWYEGRRTFSRTVEHIQSLLRRYRVRLVHVNGTRLDEPLRAGHACGVPVLVHGRVVPGADSARCEQRCTPGSDPIAEHALALADAMIVGSKHDQVLWNLLQKAHPSRRSVHLLYNQIDTRRLLVLAGPRQDQERRNVGVLSAHLLAGEVEDIRRVAERLQKRLPGTRFVMLGQETEELRRVLWQRAKDGAGLNVRFGGSMEDPAATLQDIDIVVSLSPGEGSSGSTVLEAMAAARPVVAYDCGVIPELVVHGETGYLANFGDLDAVAEGIEALVTDGERLVRFGAAARSRVGQVFPQESFDVTLDAIYSHYILGQHPVETVV